MAKKKLGTYEVFAPELICSFEALNLEEADRKARNFCKLIGRTLTIVSRKEKI